jgi:hypothetical protein
VGVNNILSEDFETDFHGLEPWDDNAPQTALVPRRFDVASHVQDMNEIQSNNGFSSSSVLAGSTVEFKLDATDVSVIDHAFLCAQITNSTGASCTIAAPAFWFSRIEIRAPNGNVLANITDLDSWITTCMLPRVEFENLAALMGTTSAYATSGVVIANTASTELYLPLLTLFNACRLHLSGLNGYLSLKFYANTSALNILAGSHPTFTKFCILTAGFNEPEEKRRARTRLYRGLVTPFNNTPIYLPHFAFDHFTQTLTLTASVTSTIKLSGLNGMFSALFFVIRASPLTGATMGTFLAIDSFSVQDESGTIFCGNHIKTHARSRVILAAQMDNESGLNSNYYMVPFSASVVQDFFMGQNHGYQVFKGNENLILTPGASFASGSCQVDVLALRGNALRILKGSIEKKQ